MCDHDNTTNILFIAKVSGPWKGGKPQDRKYEVVACKDCNQLVNVHDPEEPVMTADQIETMFRDIRKGIEAIDYAKNDLQNAIDETMNAYRELE